MSNRFPTESSTVSQAIVVGGGLSGMTAAYNLARAGLRVTVLEAKDRVGGRTHSDAEILPGGPLDLGGMLIGRSHHRSRQLGEELGLSWAPVRPAGKMLYKIDGSVVQAPDSGYPAHFGEIHGLDVALQEVYGLFDELSSRVGAAGPWEQPHHRALDAITVASWLDANVGEPLVREIVGTDINIIVGADPSELSMLFWLQYVAKCEGMHALQVTANDALWIGGAQQISQRIAAMDGIDVVTDSPVLAVTYSDESVEVKTASGSYSAPRAIIAMPPSAAQTIVFAPPLPLMRRQLQARASMGRETKVQVRYAKPFWRELGFSGEIFDLDTGYLSLDVTRPGDEWATLVAFIGGKDYDLWDQLDSGERRKRIIDSFVALLGPQANFPLAFHETDWPQVPYTMGAPVTVMPPGLLSRIGMALSEPVGPVCFAGTEAAPMWTGYMEGAVQAGEAAAYALLASQSTSLISADN